MGTHNPSATATWLRCPGSVNLCRDIPWQGSADSRIGTAAHWLAATALQKNVDASRFVGTTYTDPRDDQSVPVPITREMARDVQGYVDWVRERVAAAGASTPFVEQAVTASPADVKINGFIDAYWFGADTLHIVDYKNGVGAVSVQGNTQMMLYAEMLLATVACQGVEYVEMSVYQPRVPDCDTPVQSWVTSVASIRAWMQETVLPAVRASLRADAPLVPGESQCRWCPARRIQSCPAHSNAALAPIGVTAGNLLAREAPKLAPVQALTPADRGVLLAAIQAAGLERYIRDLKKAVEADVDSGAQTGWSWGGGRGSREWIDETTAAAILPVSIRGEITRSPYQVECAMKEAGYKPAQIKQYTEALVRVVPGRTLVYGPGSDVDLTLFNGGSL